MAEITVPVPDDLILGRLVLDAPTQMNRSGWTGKRKVIALPGIEMWRGKVMLADIATESEERQWRAFLFALGTPENWFRWVLPCATHIGPKPVIGAAPGSGYTLPLAGLTPNSPILGAGQFMTVPLPSGYDRTVCLTAPLSSDASGNATASFRPALGEVPTVGVTVETADPFIRMAPVEHVHGLDTEQGVSGAAFEVEEAR